MDGVASNFSQQQLKSIPGNFRCSPEIRFSVSIPQRTHQIGPPQRAMAVCAMKRYGRWRCSSDTVIGARSGGTLHLQTLWCLHCSAQNIIPAKLYDIGFLMIRTPLLLYSRQLRITLRFCDGMRVSQDVGGFQGGYLGRASTLCYLLYNRIGATRYCYISWNI